MTSQGTQDHDIECICGEVKCEELKTKLSDYGASDIDICDGKYLMRL